MNDAFHKFSPLTDAERVAVPAVAEEHDDGKHVSPIPADAPDVPKTHPRFGRPTAASVYRDEQGATLFRVLRFDPPGERKQFLTLSLWRGAAGLRWRWKAFRSHSCRRTAAGIPPSATLPFASRLENSFRSSVRQVAASRRCST